jgi:hypothetical protein
MAMVLFMAASVALLAGLVGLMAGHWAWMMGRQQSPRAAVVEPTERR